MKIGILGYGKEGQSIEHYFTQKGHEVAVFDNFLPEDLPKINFDGLDLILRSPSVHPITKEVKASPQHQNIEWSSITKYFFAHCPCPIIGVTGTKGKGTTCSIITDLLKNIFQTKNTNENHNRQVYLVGNIGNPALDVLDQIQPNDAVVYEMSSFQLWDLTQSPHVAVILPIEPDHLNIHDNYEDYVSAKGNICKSQTPADYCIYYHENPDTAKIANESSAQKLPYPANSADIDQITTHLSLPGRHNQEDAEAALLAVASFLDLSIEDFISEYHDLIIKTLANFQGLPHRLQFLRELNGVKYYDDNFSTTLTSLDVALKSFPEQNIVLIVGGRDKTNGEDLPKIVNLLQNTPNLTQVIFIGESGHKLIELVQPLQVHFAFTSVKTLPEAVNLAKNTAENLINPDFSAENSQNRATIAPNSTKTTTPIVLMSPAAASFDMFENVYARGAEFQKLIQELK